MRLNRQAHFGFFMTIVVATIWGCAKPNEYQPPPPPTVTVAQPVVRDVTLYMEENGETEAVERAEVRARVQGFLEEIKFEPGAEVKEGDVLYLIEQRQYQAALDSAEAMLAGAEAALIAAQADIEVAKASVVAAAADLNAKELDLKRLDQLLPQGAITQSEWDDMKAKRDSALATRDGAMANESAVKANLSQAEAQIKNARAEVNQAQINLDYTEVKAPISGRISKTDVTRGNLLQNGTLLATIVAEQEIWANFNVSERDVLRLQRREPKPEDFDITTVKAYLQRAGDEGFPYEGRLDYIDPEVDQDTGTLALRAVFENTSEATKIIPGLFVRVRVPIGILPGAILIPEQAIARDQVGSYVLAVGSDKIAQRKNVVLGSKQGEMVIVSDGLEATDSIVVLGLQRARPGTAVDPKTTTLESPEPTTEDPSEKNTDTTAAN